jgi:hypothetical protein
MSDYYNDNDGAYSDYYRQENLVAPKQVNVLHRPEWKPPKPFSPREGALDYKSWPSKGGD